MGSRKLNMFHLFFLLTFLIVYSASFLIADTYSHYSAKVVIQGNLLTEEEFGIPLEEAEETKLAETSQEEEQEPTGSEEVLDNEEEMDEEQGTDEEITDEEEQELPDTEENDESPEADLEEAEPASEENNGEE